MPASGSKPLDYESDPGFSVVNIQVSEFGLAIPLTPELADLMGYREQSIKWALVGPVVCVKDTGRALLVKFEGKETWVPRSQLNKVENEIWHARDEGMLVLPVWLAKEKGWLT